MTAPRFGGIGPSTTPCTKDYRKKYECQFFATLGVSPISTKACRRLPTAYTAFQRLGAAYMISHGLDQVIVAALPPSTGAFGTLRRDRDLKGEQFLDKGGGLRQSHRHLEPAGLEEGLRRAHLVAFGHSIAVPRPFDHGFAARNGGGDRGKVCLPQQIHDHPRASRCDPSQPAR